MKHQAARSCDYRTMAKDTEEQVTVQEQDNDASPETAELAKRVIRKIDLRILLLCFVTYNFNFMDKTVLSSAAVYGLTEDAVCLSLSLLLRFIPSKCLLTVTKASTWFAICMDLLILLCRFSRKLLADCLPYPASAYRNIFARCRCSLGCSCRGHSGLH